MAVLRIRVGAGGVFGIFREIGGVLNNFILSGLVKLRC